MPNEDTKPSPSGLDVTKLLSELEVPFSPDQVRWRVTNTTNDKKRGQIVPYADSRAYTDRLNALFTPQGWTREYKVETMTNITRMKKGESIVSGKVLVTCTVTILGIGSHSGTGEEWADDDNGMTSAEVTYASICKRVSILFGVSISPNTIKRNELSYPIYMASRRPPRRKQLRESVLMQLINSASGPEKRSMWSKTARLRRDPKTRSSPDSSPWNVG